VRGDKRAWEAFVDRYAPVILAAIRRLLTGRGLAEAAEDVAQDVFLRLVKDDFRLLRTYRADKASLVTWLTIVARSAALDMLRRKRLAAVSLDDAPPLAARAEAPAGDGPATEQLPAGVLTTNQTLVLHLLFDREMAPEAAGRLLGVSATTIRTTKHKAIAKLRQFYGTEDSA
jgi:RNA polymerase sigma factor (sigma-70 family)